MMGLKLRLYSLGSKKHLQLHPLAVFLHALGILKELYCC